MNVLNTGMVLGSFLLLQELHEATVLRLDTDKARSRLCWQPKWDFSTTVERTINWYRSNFEGKSVLDCCLNDITAYLET